MTVVHDFHIPNIKGVTLGAHFAAYIEVNLVMAFERDLSHQKFLRILKGKY